MTHLNDEQIAAAAAGLDLDGSATEHLQRCVACRSEIAAFDSLIGARRIELDAEQPDWERHTAAVMDRLPGAEPGSSWARPRWLKPVLAVAAVIVLAVAVGVLRPDRSPGPALTEPGVEEILAEMDELLSDDRIPGFEVIDPGLEALTAEIENGAS